MATEERLCDDAPTASLLLITATPSDGDDDGRRHSSGAERARSRSPVELLKPFGGSFSAAATGACDRVPSDEEVAAVLAGLQPWHQQITLRGLAVATILGAAFCIITMKLNFGSAGINPSLNIPGGLLAYVLLKALTSVGERLGSRLPLFGTFTPQENAVVQTMTCACYNIAGYAGFGSYLLAMSYQAYLNTGGAPEVTPGYDPEVIYQPVLRRIYPYLLLICFAGIFVLIGLRRLMIITWRLPYPSGTASGLMINALHTQAGEDAAKRKVRLLGYTALGSFLFDFYKWFWQGADYSCGFLVWPNLGREALEWTWNFDSQQQYIGAGMLVPHVVAWSMLLGAILSWGLLWPLLTRKAGEWYPADLGGRDFQGLFGYKVWLTIALLMGEGMYMLVKALWQAGTHLWRHYQRAPRGLPSSLAPTTFDLDDEASGPEEGGEGRSAGSGATAGIAFKETQGQRKLRSAVFSSDSIPWWVAPIGYTSFAVIGTVGIPLIYPPAKWYMVLTAYALGPLIALPNSYGAGLTDQDSCSMYAKLALYLFAAWAGAAGNGVIAGCAICGVVMVSATNAAVLMQDFRTAYITLAAPRAMLAAQVVGALLGVVLTPLAFELFWATGLVGVPGGPYPNPFADIYRGMAIIGTRGVDALPQNCGWLSLGFFAAALLLCLARDLAPERYGRLVPSPMGMGFSFYIGANNALSFWTGTLIMHIWEWASPLAALEFGPLAGAGLIVGDGLWAIPSAILAIADVSPPVCMTFVSGGTAQ